MPDGSNYDPATDLGPVYDEAGKRYGLDPDFLRAQTNVESSGNPYAVSSAGAEGISQFIPSTASKEGLRDPYDPREAIPAQAKLMRENADQFGSMPLAVAAYHGGTDPSAWGEKTRGYLDAVNAEYQRLKASRQQVAQTPEPQQQAPKIGDQINTARQAGYSDDEIASYLQQSKTWAPKFDAARKAGYLDSDIFQHFGLKTQEGTPLTNKQATQQLPAAQTEAQAPLPPEQRIAGAEPNTPPTAPPPKDTGWLGAFTAGLGSSIRGGAQTYQALAGGKPAASEPTVKAAEPIAWGDVSNPGLLGRKFLYGIAASAPEIAGFSAGAALGGGPETPLGLAAGATGAAITHAATTLGPEFGNELKATPQDPDGAFNRAMKSTGVGAAFTGLGFASFGVAPFEGTLKNLMFQAFGVQPAVAVAQKGTENVMAGRPVGEDVFQAVPGAIAMTAAPLLAHAGARRLMGHGQAPQEAAPAAEQPGQPTAAPPMGAPAPEAPVAQPRTMEEAALAELDPETEKAAEAHHADLAAIAKEEGVETPPWTKPGLRERQQYGPPAPPWEKPGLNELEKAGPPEAYGPPTPPWQKPQLNELERAGPPPPPWQKPGLTEREPPAPLKAYHGSPNSFDTFDQGRLGTTRDAGWLGRGTYFTTDENAIKPDEYKYAADIGLQNPLQIAMPDLRTDKRTVIRDALGLPRSATEQAVTDAAQAGGHDGVVLDYSPTGYHHQEIVAFDARSAAITSRTEPQAVPPMTPLQERHAQVSAAEAEQSQAEEGAQTPEHPGLVIQSLETGKRTTIQPQGTRPPSDWTEIGRNYIGQTLYQDQNGARSYIENGVRSTEPVQMIPSTPGGRRRLQVPDPADKDPEYQVAAWKPLVNSTTGRPVIHTPEWKPPEAPREETPQPEEQRDPDLRVADWAARQIAAYPGREPFSAREIQGAADHVFGGKLADGAYGRDRLYDAQELGVNLFIQRHPERFDPAADAETAKGMASDLEAVKSHIPTQTVRAGEKDTHQQFSTPPDFAYAAAWAANLRPEDRVLEPSAGTGSLAVMAQNAKVSEVTANEISPKRSNMLSHLGVDRLTSEDARQIHNALPDDIKPSVVLMNPPFSAAPGRMGNKMVLGEGAAHVKAALDRLEPNGRLVAIVGRGMTMDAPAFRDWWKAIGNQYDVRANVGVGGGVYRKYGTNFGTRLLVIDKAAPSGRPISGGDVGSAADLIDKLKDVRDDRPVEQLAGQPSGVPLAESGERPVPGGHELPGATGVVGPGERPASPAPEQPSPAGPQRRGTRGRQAPVAGAEGGGEREPVAAGGPEREPAGTGEQPPRPIGPSEIPTGGRTAGGGDGVREDGSGQLDEPGVTPTPEIVVQSEKAVTDPNEKAISEAVYENYRPQRLKIPGAKEHPGALVQSAAMASVMPPEPKYTPKLPKALVTSGRLSNAQLEAVVYAGQAHQEMLPDGSRRRLLHRRRDRRGEGARDRRHHRRQHGPGPQQAHLDQREVRRSSTMPSATGAASATTRTTSSTYPRRSPASRSRRRRASCSPPIRRCAAPRRSGARRQRRARRPRQSSARARPASIRSRTGSARSMTAWWCSTRRTTSATP